MFGLGGFVFIILRYRNYTARDERRILVLSILSPQSLYTFRPWREAYEEQCLLISSEA